MACLPSTLSQFRDQVYWDHFFKERKGAPFEWYGSLKDFRDALASLNLQGGPARSSSQGPLILHVGCGNSCLPKELYDEGYKRIVNVDFSPVVIEEMKARYSQFPSLEWRCLDVRGRGLQEAFLTPPQSSPPFDVILDKGFLDAYLSIDHEEAVLSERSPQDISQGGPQGGPPGAPLPQDQGQADGACAKSKPYDYRKAAAEYFEAVLEVLREGGSFVLISLAQDYVLKEFPFLIRVLKCQTEEEASPPAETTQVYVHHSDFCCSRKQQQQQLFQSPSDKHFRAAQLTTRGGERVAAVSSQSPGKRVVLHVGGGCGTFGRCCVAVYDSTNKAHAAKAQTAALLVPPGQELTWTFASPEGNQQVADQLEAARLLVVTFPIGFGSEETQEFSPLQWRKTIEEAQKTLGPLLKEFALPNNDLIPILTLGEQAPVREVLWQQGSPLAGRILVRDVRDTSANAEASTGAADGGTGGAAFAFSSKVVGAPWGATSGIDAVLLGLGGGVLGNLLHHLFGHVGLSLTCVELDPIVIDIAKKDVNEVAVAVKEGGASPQSNQPVVTQAELLKRLQHLERCFLQHTGGKGGWLVGQTAKAWAAQMKPWPLPKSSGKNGR
ncbi:hypothetical protein Emed_000330 [Eimeria media]